MAVGALVVELAATTVDGWLRERSQLPPKGSQVPSGGSQLPLEGDPAPPGELLAPLAGSHTGGEGSWIR